MLHSSLSHMRLYHCLDLSGPWRQRALMCTTFLYVQTHLTSQKEKASGKIKWNTKEKGGRIKRSLSLLLLYLHQGQIECQKQRDFNARTLALQETPTILMLSSRGNHFSPEEKLVFSSKNLAPGPFSQENIIWGGVDDQEPICISIVRRVWKSNSKLKRKCKVLKFKENRSKVITWIFSQKQKYYNLKKNAQHLRLDTTWLLHRFEQIF